MRSARIVVLIDFDDDGNRWTATPLVSGCTRAEAAEALRGCAELLSRPPLPVQFPTSEAQEGA